MIAGLIIVGVLGAAIAFFYFRRDSVERQFQKALDLEEQGELTEAIDVLENIQEPEPESIIMIAEMKYQLGKKLIESHPAKAREAFQTILDISNNPVYETETNRSEFIELEVKAEIEIIKIQFEEGKHFFEYGHYELALKKFEAIKDTHNFAKLKIAETKLKMALKLTNDDINKTLSLINEILAMKDSFEDEIKIAQNKYKAIEKTAKEMLPDMLYKKAIFHYLNNDLNHALEQFNQLKHENDFAALKIAEVKLKLAKKVLHEDLDKAEELLVSISQMQNIFKRKANKYLLKKYKVIEQEAKDLQINITYEKAIKLYQNGKTLQALQQLDKLKNNYVPAILKIAEIKYEIAQNLENQKIEVVVSAFNDVLEVRKKLLFKSEKVRKSLEPIEIKATTAIVNIYLKQGEKSEKSNDLETATQLFENAYNQCTTKTPVLKENCLIALQNIYYQRGVNSEKTEVLLDASVLYNKALFYSLKMLPTNPLMDEIEARIEICKLKQKQKPDTKKIHQLIHNRISCKKNLIFRLAVYHAENGDIEIAQNILIKHFESDNSVEIQQLKSYCSGYYRQTAIEKIAFINDAIQGNEEKLVQLNKSFDFILTVIQKGLPNIYERVKKIKRIVFYQLLNKYVNNDEFEKIVTHITSNETFYQNPELLRNAGIACLQLVQNQKIHSYNYKIVIATWLTMVYSHAAMIAFIKSTDWADDFSFTLTNVKYANAPISSFGNINYQPKSRSNIAIAEIQQQLITLFENSINQLPNNHLYTILHNFYQEEKMATEKITPLIDSNLFYATPFFAKKYDLGKAIVKGISPKFTNKQDSTFKELSKLYSS